MPRCCTGSWWPRCVIAVKLKVIIMVGETVRGRFVGRARTVYIRGLRLWAVRAAQEAVPQWLAIVQYI